MSASKATRRGVLTLLSAILGVILGFGSSPFLQVQAVEPALPTLPFSIKVTEDQKQVRGRSCGVDPAPSDSGASAATSSDQARAGGE